jgi:hypothetical protein
MLTQVALLFVMSPPAKSYSIQRGKTITEENTYPPVE